MLEILENCYPWTISVVTCIVITLISAFLHYSRFIYPQNVIKANNEYYYWRYRNFFISLIHASITGISSMITAFYQPELIVDVLDSYNEFGYNLTAFSLGYFMYDTIEMITHFSYKGTTELIIHHVLILGCFSNTLYFKRFVGYNMVALMIEFSNIFLHFRQLLLLSNYPRSGQYYQVNCIINIVFFILVRGGCMVWLWITLLLSYNKIPFITYATALTSMIGITITTTILFRRLINADFIVDGLNIQRRKVNSPRVNITNSSSEIKPDLYEAMEDSMIKQNKRNKMLDGALLSKNVENVANAVVN